MHPVDITAALVKKSISQSEIGASVRPPVDASYVSKVIHGHNQSERVEARIAEATGFPLHRLWPTRYNRPRKTA